MVSFVCACRWKRMMLGSYHQEENSFQLLMQKYVSVRTNHEK